MGNFTIDTDLAALDGAQTKAWLESFGNMIENAFIDCSNEQRLLGNLLVLVRYCNTLQQGLTGSGKRLSLGLQKAMVLLWDFLEGNAVPAEFADFSNDLYACYYFDSVGDLDELPEPFYIEYFGDDRPCGYEWMAVEWAAGLLLQLVSIAGGAMDFDDFEDCRHVDFYGVHLLLDQLEGITEDGVIPPFQEIAQVVQSDLRRARGAVLETYALLREEYQEYTLMPEKYAGKLLEY